MATDDIDNFKSKLDKFTSNNQKLNKIIFDLEKDIALLTSKKDTLNEEVTKLNEQIIGIQNELSLQSQHNVVLKDEIKMKTKDITVVAVELEQIKWQKTWYSIIAENQSAELKVNYDKMYALSVRKKNNESSKSNDANDNSIDEKNVEIEKMKVEITKMEQEIHFLKRTLPTQAAIDKIESEILTLQDRNKSTLNSMKAQLVQLQYRNSQDQAYLESLQKKGCYVTQN